MSSTSLKEAVAAAVNSGVSSEYGAAMSVFRHCGYEAFTRAAALVICWERELLAGGLASPRPIDRLADGEFRDLLALAASWSVSESFDRAFDTAFSDWLEDPLNMDL